MRKRLVLGATALTLGLVGLAAAFSTVLSSQKKNVVTNPDAAGIPPAWRLAQDPSVRDYTVEPMPVRGNVKARTPQEEESFQQAAAIILRERPLPPERLKFFDWMSRADSPATFRGWGCFVEQVTPNPDGWLITVWVTPQASADGGAVATVHNRFIEEYQWSNGVLRFVKGYPHPMFGSEPSISWM